MAKKVDLKVIVKQHAQNKGKFLQENVKQEVVNFYERDTNSRACPG